MTNGQSAGTPSRIGSIRRSTAARVTPCCRQVPPSPPPHLEHAGEAIEGIGEPGLAALAALELLPERAHFGFEVDWQQCEEPVRGRLLARRLSRCAVES
jgi:hypothetical protein